MPTELDDPLGIEAKDDPLGIETRAEPSRPRLDPSVITEPRSPEELSARNFQARQSTGFPSSGDVRMPDQPIIKSPISQEDVEMVQQMKPFPGAPAMAGAAKELFDAASSFTSPDSLIQLGLMAVPGIGRVAMAKGAVDSIHQTPELYDEAIDAVKSGDSARIAQSITKGLISTGMAVAMGKGSVRPVPGGSLPEGISPEVARVMQQPVVAPPMQGPIATGEVLPMPRVVPPWRRPAFQMPDAVEPNAQTAARIGEVPPVSPIVRTYEEAKAEEVDPKKAWQMTKAEWADATRKKLAPSNAELKAAGFSGETTPNMSAHYWTVKHAIDRGDPVPPEVLADYPDLSKAPPAAPTEGAPTPRNWDAFYENLIGELDSFSPARNTGRINYDLEDVAQRFVDYAKSDKSGKPLDELVRRFAEDDDATKGQINKLNQSVKSILSQEPPVVERGAPPPAPVEVKAEGATGASVAEPAKGEPAVVPPGEQVGQIPTENPFDTSATSQRLTELQQSKPRPLKKLYGPNPTPEQVASSAAETKAWNREYRKAQKAHKETVEKSNEWIAQQKQPSQPEPTPPSASEPGTEGKIGQGPGGKTYSPSAKPEAAESFEGTSLKNAVAELEAAGVGHDLTPAEQHAMAPLWDKAGDTLTKDADAGKRLADNLVANPERGMTDEQSALLLRHKVKLVNELNAAAERTNVGDAESRSIADREYVSKSNELKALLDAIKKRGTHWGREGRWRQAMAYEDYSFATQEGLLRAAKGGEHLTPTERTKLLADIEAWKKNAAEQEAHRVKSEAASRDLAVKLALDAIEKENLRKLVPTFDKRILAAAEKIVVRMETAAKPHADALREMLSRMGTTPDPTVVMHAAYVASARIARAGLDLAKLTDEFVREYGPKIKPMMGDIWQKANELLDAQKIPEKVVVAIRKKSEARTPLTEEQRLAVMKAGMVRRQAEMEQRIAKGDFSKKKRPTPPPLDPEGARLMAQGREIANRFEKARRAAELALRSPAKKFVDRAIVGTYNSLRSIAVMGHGTVGMFTHAGGLFYRPTTAIIWWRNFLRQFPMWLRPAYHEQLIHRLKTDPDFHTWLKAGAKIDPDKVYTDYEQYGKFLGKLAAGGARGFDSLKLARMELNKAQWEKISDDIKADPEKADAARHAIAEINNKATGTSTLFGKVDSASISGVAHALFFAPKLYASRWSRVVLDPLKTVKTFAEWDHATPQERVSAELRLKHAVEFTAAYLAGLAINQGLLKASGSNQNVNFSDPTKTDWLKFKAHGKTIVADGGLLDPIRLLGQVVYGDLIKSRTKQERFLKGSRFESAVKDLGRYARSKFNPSLGLVVDSATQQDFSGRALPFSNEPSKYKTQKPYTWGEFILSHGPIPVGSGTRVAYDEMQRRGLSKPDAAALLEGAAAASIGLTGAHETEDYSIKK